MPYSGNLYPADGDSDGDGESFSDELSPTDGYFSRNEMQANPMVPDPSIDCDEEPEAKTLIPTPRQATTGETSRTSHPSLPHIGASQNYASPPSNENLPTSPTSTRSSRRREVSFSENTPVMYNPPPAYSATPSPTSISSQDLNGRRYNTFPEHHLERGFLQPRGSESMGGPVDDPNERSPLVNEGIRYSPRRRRVKRILFVALVLAVIATVVSIVFGCKASGPKKNPGKKMPSSKDRPLDSTTPYCPSATIRSEQAVYEFSVGADFSVIQTTHDSDDPTRGTYVETAGEIRLRRLPKDSKHGNRPYFTVNVSLSEEMEVKQAWDHNSQTLKVSTPKYAPRGFRDHPCVSLEITAWLPENAEFSNLLVESVTLTLRVLDDIKIKVAGRSKFSTVTGNVFFPTIDGHLSTSEKDVKQLNFPKTSEKYPPIDPFLSRRVTVETISGSIDGIYPLMDVLAISSQSGSIDVGVSPKPVLKSAPAPADLEVQTGSGSIRVKLPIKDTINPTYAPPPRDYITRVHSTAGSIDGTYYLGSESSFKSTVGSVQITALPILQSVSSGDGTKVPPNTFETHTISGGTSVEVLDPIFISALPSTSHKQPESDPYIPIGDDDPYKLIPPTISVPIFTNSNPETPEDTKKALRTLRSSHTASSATITVSYPTVWEGSIHAKTVSGSIALKGEGLRKVKERNGWGFKEVLARKGVDGEKEGCYVDMGAVSGGLTFEIRGGF